jgi:hypothetical protein
MALMENMSHPLIEVLPSRKYFCFSFSNTCAYSCMLSISYYDRTRPRIQPSCTPMVHLEQLKAPEIPMGHDMLV